MLKSYQQQLQILPPQGIFSPAQWLPFDLYQWLPRYPRYSPNPFMFNHPSFYFYEVGWHSNYSIVFAHSIQYKMLRSVISNSLDQILIILRSGFPINNIIDKKYGYNSLQIASITNNYPLIELLLLRGADVNSKDRWGNTPVMLAVTNNNHEAIHSLIKNGGCDPKIQNKYGFDAYDKARQNLSIIQFFNNHLLTNRTFPKFLVGLQLQKLINPPLWQQIKKMKIYTGKIGQNDLSKWQFDLCDYRETQELLKQSK